MKRKPVNRNKMRLNEEIEHGFDSIKTPSARVRFILLAYSFGAASMSGLLRRFCGCLAQSGASFFAGASAEFLPVGDFGGIHGLVGAREGVFGRVVFLEAMYAVGK